MVGVLEKGTFLNTCFSHLPHCFLLGSLALSVHFTTQIGLRAQKIVSAQENNKLNAKNVYQFSFKLTEMLT